MSTVDLEYGCFIGPNEYLFNTWCILCSRCSFGSFTIRRNGGGDSEGGGQDEGKVGGCTKHSLPLKPRSRKRTRRTCHR